VLLEAGEAETVRRLREMPLDLLTLAVHRLIQVQDRDQWSQTAEDAGDEDDDDDRSGGLYAPWHELVLVARDERGWDSVLCALLALDEEDHALLRRVLDRCRRLDAERDAERDELHDEALPEDLALESDVAAERDARHAETGFVAFADARAFLQLARAVPPVNLAALARDAITRAYFRELAREAAARPEPQPVAEPVASGALAVGADRAALSSLLELLADSGVVPESSPGGPGTPAAALGPGAALTAQAAPDAERGAAQGAADTLLHGALRAIGPTAPQVWSERMDELGYLANVILAGCTTGARPFSPEAALDAATAVTSFGLELQLRGQAYVEARAADLLRSIGADRLFRAGYAALHRDIVEPAREVLRDRCGAYAPAAHRPAIDAALRGEELGVFPEDLDADLLRLTEPQWKALRGLAESLPVLAGTLASGVARFVGTREHVRSAQRLLDELDTGGIVIGRR
jgi:hypothetical protein